jgi:serine-threonine kinase receptor-associated protein
MLRHGTTGDWIGTFAGHKGAVWSTKLCSEALLAATGSADFSAKIWDAITGKELHDFAHKHIVKSVEFSPNRQSLITSGHEGLLRIFDLGSLQLTAEIPHDPTSANPLALKCAWGSDPNTVITGASDGTVNVYDIRSSSKRMGFKAGSGPLGSVSETDHVKRLGGAPRTSHVQDMEMRVLSSGDPIFTVASGAAVSIYDGRTFELRKTFALPINFLHEGGASMHPSGRRFVAGGSDVEVRVFDASSGAELECHKGHHGPVRCVRYAPGGETYATGSEDGTIRIWDDLA